MSIRSAYGAGFRAGMAPKALQLHTDGTKTIRIPSCPFNKWWQVVPRFLYWEGYHSGLYTSLRRWIVSRKQRVAV